MEGSGIRARVRVHRVLQRKYSRSPLRGAPGEKVRGAEGFMFRFYICLGPRVKMVLSKSQAVEKVSWQWLHGSRRGPTTRIKGTEECLKLFWLITEKKTFF